MHQDELVVRGALGRLEAAGGRLRGSRWSLLAVTLAVVAIGALGLAGCVADPAPVMGDAIAGDGEVTLHWAAPPPDNGVLIVKIRGHPLRRGS